MSYYISQLYQGHWYLNQTTHSPLRPLWAVVRDLCIPESYDTKAEAERSLRMVQDRAAALDREAAIERRAELEMDRLDRRYLRGDMSRAEYESEVQALHTATSLELQAGQ